MRGIFAAEKWQMLVDHLGKFAEGFGMTLFIVLFGLLLSLTLGILFGILSVSRLKILRALARVYVEFFQNTPLLVQIFFLYNALPYLGTVMPVTLIGILGLDFITAPTWRKSSGPESQPYPPGNQRLPSLRGSATWK